MSIWWTPSYIPYDEADKIVEDYEKGLCIYGTVTDWENSLRGKKDDLDYKILSSGYSKKLTGNELVSIERKN